MKLVLVQNRVGKFNLLGDEESLAFSVGFKDDDGQYIKVGKNGLPVEKDSDEPTCSAIFSMPSNEEDPHGASVWYEEMFNLYAWEDLFAEHQKHGGFSTGLDYPEQRIMFAYFMQNHYVEIQNSAVEAEKKADLLEINRLQKRLAELRKKKYQAADPEDTPQLFTMILDELRQEVQRYHRYRDEYKEGNETWERWDKRAKEVKKKIEAIKIVAELGAEPLDWRTR